MGRGKQYSRGLVIFGTDQAHNDFEVLNDGCGSNRDGENLHDNGRNLNYYCGGENVDAKEMTAVIDYEEVYGRFDVMEW